MQFKIYWMRWKLIAGIISNTQPPLCFPHPEVVQPHLNKAFRHRDLWLKTLQICTTTPWMQDQRRVSFSSASRFYTLKAMVISNTNLALRNLKDQMFRQSNHTLQRLAAQENLSIDCQLKSKTILQVRARLGEVKSHLVTNNSLISRIRWIKSYQAKKVFKLLSKCQIWPSDRKCWVKGMKSSQ